MYTLFALGTVGFWVLSVMATLLLLLLVEFEKSGWAFITTAATVALLYFFGNSGIFGWVFANPGLVVAGVIGYVVIGALWSILKWVLFVKDRKEKFIEFRSRFMNAWSPVTAPSRTSYPGENAKEAFKLYMASDSSRYEREDIRMPEPRDHKSRIMHWMGYWPWSVLNSILFDFVRRIFLNLYNLLAGVFRDISRSIYKDVMEDMEDKNV
jgi:hypothetical protein